MRVSLNPVLFIIVINAMIQIKNISLSYEDELVLDNVSCEISKGQNVCFWGPSGSGKSSLLKLLMGFEIPSSGEIIIDGIPVNEENITDIRKNIGWIPQNINLPVNNTKELIKLLYLDKKQEKEFNDYTKKLNLDDNLLNKDFQEISGGQKQRIVIAAVLSLDKPILLMDEPTSALDADSVDNLINLILKNNELTVISASHDKKWADANDQILHLDQS